MVDTNRGNFHHHLVRLAIERQAAKNGNALEIICAVMGTNPTPRGVSLIRSRTMTSYEYLRLTLDRCLEAEEVVSQPMPLLRSVAPPLDRRRTTERPSPGEIKAVG